MPSIASLSVQMSGDTRRLEVSMKKARLSIVNFAAGVWLAQQALKPFRFLLSAGRSVLQLITKAFTNAIAKIRQFTVHLRSAMTTMDRLSKASDTIDITTKELSGLALAAEITGTTITVLIKGLQRMNRGLGEATIGIGQAKDAYRELGLEIDEMRELTGGERFILLADRLSKVANSADRARLEIQLLGRSGINLKQLVDLGSKGIERLKNESDELGFSFNRIDGAKIELANDAITRMKFAFRGIFNTLAIKLSPIILAVTDKLIAMAKSGGGLRQKVSNMFDTAVVRLVLFIDKMKQFIALGVLGFAKILEMVSRVADVVPRLIGSFASWVESAKGGLAAVVSRFQHLVKLSKLVVSRAFPIISVFRGLRAMAVAFGQGMTASLGSIPITIDQVKSAIGVAIIFTQKWKALFMRFAVFLAKNIGHGFARFIKGLKANFKTVTVVVNALKLLIGATAIVAVNVADKIKSVFTTMKDTLKPVTDNIIGFFEQLVEWAGKVVTAFKPVGEKIRSAFDIDLPGAGLFDKLKEKAKKTATDIGKTLKGPVADALNQPLFPGLADELAKGKEQFDKTFGADIAKPIAAAVKAMNPVAKMFSGAAEKAKDVAKSLKSGDVAGTIFGALAKANADAERKAAESIEKRPAGEELDFGGKGQKFSKAGRGFLQDLAIGTPQGGDTILGVNQQQLKVAQQTFAEVKRGNDLAVDGSGVIPR